MKKCNHLFLIIIAFLLVGCDGKQRNELKHTNEKPFDDNKKDAVIETKPENLADVTINDDGIFADISKGLESYKLDASEYIEIDSISFMESTKDGSPTNGWSVSNNNPENCHVRLPKKIEYAQKFPSCLTVNFDSAFNTEAVYKIKIFGAIGKDWLIEFIPIIRDKREVRLQNDI